MHPTVTEQLDGLRRILAEAVTPEVTAPYPAEILGSVIGALNALQSNLHAIPAFLRWDIETTAGVLDAAKPLLGADLTAEIDAAKAGDDDLAALEPRQVLMRGLLVKAMPAIRAERGAAYGKMIALFRERTERFPFSMAVRPPAKKS
ncbi:MAG TPA: hypothetical protein VH722_17975 [Alphaproteobacteria bacterium]|jgi:hypothetical protein|nr:hypothetical protein [Alphaproteobacteria bacterium]